jgi:hypothetical protein
MPDELKKTKLFELAEEEKKKFDETYEYSPRGLRTQFSHKIPNDALLINENGSCIQREDHDVPAGAVVEIYIPRKKRSNQLNLKGKRFTHFSTEIKTTNPLATRSESNQEKRLQ